MLTRLESRNSNHMRSNSQRLGQRGSLQRYPFWKRDAAERLHHDLIGKSSSMSIHPVGCPAFAQIYPPGFADLTRFLAMVPVIQRWINGNVLSQLESGDVGTNLNYGTGHLVTQRNRQFSACVSILLPWLRWEDWSPKIFVDIRSAYPTKRNLYSYLAILALPDQYSVCLHTVHGKYEAYILRFHVLDSDIIFAVESKCSDGRHCHPTFLKVASWFSVSLLEYK
jgi:hypothetical protein